MRRERLIVAKSSTRGFQQGCEGKKEFLNRRERESDDLYISSILEAIQGQQQNYRLRSVDEMNSVLIEIRGCFSAYSPAACAPSGIYLIFVFHLHDVIFRR